jgi:5'-deoxynucleotidase YfbR-like HD superfamily hydrolase
MWIQTYSGRAFDYSEVWEGISQDIGFLDIAVSLSKQERFLGHTTQPCCTVAEHSVIVSQWAERAAREAGRIEGAPLLAARLGLLHDAHEAYLGDLPRPLKQFLRSMDGFAYDHLCTLIQEQVETALVPNFSLIKVVTGEARHWVQQADRWALAAERSARGMLAHGSREWEDLGERPDWATEVPSKREIGSLWTFCDRAREIGLTSITSTELWKVRL